MIPEFPTKLARVGAILTLLGSIIWVQWPPDLSKLNAAAVVLFIGSAVAWIGIELAEFANSKATVDGSQRDDALKFNSLIGVIDKRQYYVLRHKQIQTYMEDDDYDGLRRLIDLQHLDIFPFHNSQLQALYERFREKSREFYSEFYDLYSSTGDGSSTWRPGGGEHGDGWVDDDRYREIMKKKRELDQQASMLADLWEEFVQTARRELKGSAIPLERYELEAE